MVRAWHFVGEKLRDGQPIPDDGEWLIHTGELALCASGLHASRHPMDALQYAPGTILCLVECDGKIIEQQDKLVCERRRIVARKDAADGIRYFARMQALSVAHLWDIPDVCIDFLMTGIARANANAAANDAANATTRAAAMAANDAAIDAANAANAAANDAANAATSAAWNAAKATTWATTWPAARALWRDLCHEAFSEFGEMPQDR